VTDGHACKATATTTISQPSVVSAGITGQTNLRCKNDNSGTATVSGSGGTPGYTYLWNNSQTNAQAVGLTAGTYTVTVSDAHACKATATVTITEPANGVSIAYTKVDIPCNGGTSGSIDITASGGSSGYSYFWSGPNVVPTSEDQTGLGAGSYFVTVTDASTCRAFATVIITQPGVVSAQITSITHVTNYGGSDGSATVTASGGTPAYIYIWNNSQTTSTTTGLSEGTYTVTVTDAHSCTATATVLITQPTELCLKIKAFLQGPYDPAQHKMRDDLRAQGFLPATDPYATPLYDTSFVHVPPSGLATVLNPSVVFADYGDNSIVDWVFIELRDKNDKTLVKYTRSVLLQRDGDVVDLDGTSKVCLYGLPDNTYYIALRHRNHFGVMTAVPKLLTTAGTVVDFTTMNPSNPNDEFNFGTASDMFPGVNYSGLSQSTTSDGKRAMWYGNSHANRKIKYEAGSDPDDQSIILSDVIDYQFTHGLPLPQSGYDFCFGYLAGDVDMNGKAKYEAPYDDRSLILYQILFYPLNGLFLSAYDQMIEQLPRP
jgi:hypothetical protein